MIKLRIKGKLMLKQQGCQSLSAKGSIMVHWMPLQRVKITEKEGIIFGLYFAPGEHSAASHY